MSRIVAGGVAILALAIGILWAAGVLDVLTDPGFNPNRRLAQHETRSLTLFGSVGVLTTLAIGASGLAYAKTAKRVWLAVMVIGVVIGVPVFVEWIERYNLAGGVN